MVRFSIDTVRSLMDNPLNIRNFSVVAHVDHGKSTLTDSLLFSNEIISKDDVGVKRATDTRPDEALKGITIKSTGVTLHYQLPEEVALPHDSKGRQFLINLIDSPGHVDFSSEVTAALRLTDGALVLVDCVEGSCVQTETVLRQALAERIKPVLAINKLDRAFVELQLEPEAMYQKFCESIESVNSTIRAFKDDVLGDVQVHPSAGTICFSAGKQGWAFSIRQFARFYAKKIGASEESLVEKLWGDNYWDPETKKWTTSSTSSSGKPLPRGFCKFILEPIGQVFRTCLTEKPDEAAVDKVIKTTGISLTSEERTKRGKDLLKEIMQKWLPAADAILEMIVTRLPSPVVAQKYRVETLYTGPMDDETAASIRACDPKGPLVMYISKMIPTKDNSRFMAFGRVFSGTVSCQKVRVMGANFVPGKKDDLAVNQSIQRVQIVMGGRTEPVESVPCGNTCALIGVDNVLSKSGTITTLESSYPLLNMKYSVSPVVRVAVSCKNPAELPKLIEGLKRLSKTDSLVQVISEQTGEHIIACAGDLHLEICLSDLRGLMKDCELVVSQPVVAFQETVTDVSSLKCLAKSPNNHNRITAMAEPLGEVLLNALSSGSFNAREDPKTRATKLTDFGWDLGDARKVWAFGPEVEPLNSIVDMTRGVQYLNEVKDSIVSAFHLTSANGILAEEPLRGVRFNVIDAVLHSDKIHRGNGQIMPASQRAFSASQLTAKPRLLEPMYLVDISCNDKCIGDVYSALNKKKGIVVETFARIGTPLYTIKAHLPVTESFGFSSFLRDQTSGQAFPQLVFDHWRVVDDDPFDDTSRSFALVKKIRERKGIEANIPALDRFYDKL